MTTQLQLINIIIIIIIIIINNRYCHLPKYWPFFVKVKIFGGDGIGYGDSHGDEGGGIYLLTKFHIVCRKQIKIP